MIRFCTQAILVIDTVYIQETIRTNLRYFVVGLLFIVECVGLFMMLCLVKLFNENWRIAFMAVVSLGFICLILRLFAAESYKWLNKMNRPGEACESVNYCCRFQQDSFFIG